MPSTTVVKVKIEELSKYGFKANGKYVGLSKQLKDADKARLVPGAEFEAEYYIADSGKEYLNKILIMSDVSAPGVTLPSVAAKAAVDTERAKKFTPKFNKPETKADPDKMSKAEWSAKDRSQLIGGLSHDAAAVAVAVLNLDGSNEPGTESALRVYKTLLEGMLKIREEVK